MHVNTWPHAYIQTRTHEHTHALSNNAAIWTAMLSDDTFFSSPFWQLKPKNHLPSKMPGIKEAERVSGLGEGGMRSRKGWRRIEEVKNWELCGRRESSAPAIPLTSCPFRICWLRKIHNSKIMVHCLWFSSLSIRGDLNIPFEPSPQGGHCSFLFPLVFTAWIQHTMLGIHHLAALYFVFMPRKFFS